MIRSGLGDLDAIIAMYRTTTRQSCMDQNLSRDTDVEGRLASYDPLKMIASRSPNPLRIITCSCNNISIYKILFQLFLYIFLKQMVNYDY